MAKVQKQLNTSHCPNEEDERRKQRASRATSQDPPAFTPSSHPHLLYNAAKQHSAEIYNSSFSFKRLLLHQ